jgi:hypothetical protein
LRNAQIVTLPLCWFLIEFARWFIVLWWFITWPRIGGSIPAALNPCNFDCKSMTYRFIPPYYVLKSKETPTYAINSGNNRVPSLHCFLLSSTLE